MDQFSGAGQIDKTHYTAFDGVGNPLTMTDEGGTTVTYGYNPRNMINKACVASDCSATKDLKWNYDAVGNRTKEIKPSGTTTYTYDDRDRLLIEALPTGDVVYKHDENGNMTAIGSRTFQFDLAGRTASTTSGGAVTTSYGYDGDGVRVQSSSGSDVTNFEWDVNHGLPMLAREADASSAELRRYTYGNGVISTRSGGTSSYYHDDLIGSITKVTSSSGAPQWSYSYTPFGGRTTTKETTSAPNNFFRFAGEYQDAGTGLYHLRARQYDPGIGRFTAQDPLIQPYEQSYQSTYAYADNAPTTTVDPSGLDGCQVQRGGDPVNAYWNIRSHLDYWDQQAQAGATNPNATTGFFQWGSAKILGGLLDGSGLDTVQASAETLGTACTSTSDQIKSGLSIAAVGASWFGGATATVSRAGWSSVLWGRGGLGGTGSSFKGIFNRSTIRAGWGWHNGPMFRIGIGSGPGRTHLDLWRGGWPRP